MTEVTERAGTPRAEYMKISEDAWAEFKKIEVPAKAEYHKAIAAARAKYDKINAVAEAKYYKSMTPIKGYDGPPIGEYHGEAPPVRQHPHHLCFPGRTKFQSPRQ